MTKIEFAHGGPEYDRGYPDGIPTSLIITTQSGQSYDSGLIMYPSGHARNNTANLENILQHKFQLLASLAVTDVPATLQRLSQVAKKNEKEVDEIYSRLPLIVGKNRGEY